MKTVPEMLEEIGELISSKPSTYGDRESIILQNKTLIRISNKDRKPDDILLYPIAFSDPVDGPTVKSWNLIEKILLKLEAGRFFN